MSKRGDEYYTQKAQQEGYLARSVYKLQEIDDKFDILLGAKHILDIGCAPGSWLQYLSTKLHIQEPHIIGFDLKKVEISLPGVQTYEQDISDRDGVKAILDSEGIQQFDLIVSDMAPDTIGMSDIDAIRSIGLIEKTLWIYEQYLTPEGKFAIKVFMGPGYQEFIRDLKERYGQKSIVTFKPKSCRKKSKEIYVVKRS